MIQLFDGHGGFGRDAGYEQPDGFECAITERSNRL
jgi:hypothetical protein